MNTQRPEIDSVLEDQLGEIFKCYSDMLKAVEPDEKQRQRYEEYFANRIDEIDSTAELLKLVQDICSIEG